MTKVYPYVHLVLYVYCIIVYILQNGVDTKQRLSKQRHHKTATVTKQRQLQNSDSYKTATIKQNSDIYKTATVTKRRKII